MTEEELKSGDILVFIPGIVHEGMYVEKEIITVVTNCITTDDHFSILPLQDFHLCTSPNIEAGIIYRPVGQTFLIAKRILPITRRIPSYKIIDFITKELNIDIKEVKRISRMDNINIDS